MKAKAPDYAGFTIRHTYSDGDVCIDGLPTTSALDRLDAAMSAAISAEYPGAEVEVDCRRRTSGESSTRVSAPEGRWAEEEEVKEGAQAAAGGAWEAWSVALTDVDLGLCSVPGCGRDAYAHGLCEPHDRRRRRGSSSTAPVRERGTEPLRALSLRVPTSVYEMLGVAPAAQARHVLEVWARRARRAVEPARQRRGR